MSRRGTATPEEKELKDAIVHGRTDTVRRILRSHPDWLSAKVGGTYLEFSGKKNQQSQQSVLCLYPAAFLAAARKGDTDEIKALTALVEITQTDAQGHTALHLAASAGLTKAAQVLLDQGALAANGLAIPAGPASEYAGYTPLVVALARGNFDVASVFADSGALELKLEDGNTPLSWAIQSAFQASAESDIVTSDSQDTMFLMSGKSTPGYKHRTECALWLIKAGADIHTKYESGITPLMMAALCNVESVCELLLQYGVDPDVIDADGQTALGLCKTVETQAVLHNVASARYTKVEVPPGGVVMAGSNLTGVLKLHLRNSLDKPILEDVWAKVAGYALTVELVDYNEGIFEINGGIPSKPGPYELEISPMTRKNIRIARVSLNVMPAASGSHSFVRGITEEQMRQLECGSEISFTVEFYDSTGRPSTGNVTVAGDALITDTGGATGVKLKPRQDGHAVSGTAHVGTKPGLATLDFLVNDQSASGFPVDVEIKPGPTCAGTCVAFGPALSLAGGGVVGGGVRSGSLSGPSGRTGSGSSGSGSKGSRNSWTSPPEAGPASGGTSAPCFYIQSHDRFANRRNDSGDVFTGYLAGVEMISVPIKPVLFEPGTYRGTFQASKGGWYKLHVMHVTTVDGAVPILGSPFDVRVADPPLAEYVEEDVEAWLEDHGLRHFGYGALFARHGVTYDVLPAVTDAYLVEMGVTQIGPRARLMRAVAELNGGVSSSGPAPVPGLGPGPAHSGPVSAPAPGHMSRPGPRAGVNAKRGRGDKGDSTASADVVTTPNSTPKTPASAPAPTPTPNPNAVLHYGRYAEEDVIHVSAGGSVHVVGAIDTKTNERVALKIYKSSHREDYENELYWLEFVHRKAAAGKYVVRLIGHEDGIKSKSKSRGQGLGQDGDGHDSDPCLVLERGSMSIADLTRGQAVRQQQKLRWYVKSAGSAINFLHSIGVSHGNVKPSNLVLFEGASGSGSGPQIKLIDLSSCALISELTSGLHTAEYCSPALARSLVEVDPIQSSKEHDAWALFITAFELFAGRNKLMALFGDAAGDEDAVLRLIADTGDTGGAGNVSPLSGGFSTSSPTPGRDLDSSVPSAGHSQPQTPYQKFYRKAPKTVEGVLTAAFVSGK